MNFVDAAEAPARRNNGQIKLHGPEAFEGMREAGQLAAECLDMLAPEVRGRHHGAARRSRARVRARRGALPACLFYRGYRHTICTSLNHVVCHGIPGERVLKDGDIVNIDVTVIVDGWHGDTSRMYAVGRTCRARPAADGRHLRSDDARHRGDQARRDARRSRRRDPIHAEAERESVVREFCGHGLGRVFHDAPNILHFGRRGQGDVLMPGMIFTVEPMIKLGAPHVKC